MWLLSPIGNIQCLSFEQIWIPFTQLYFVPNEVEIGPYVLEVEIFKSYVHVLTLLLLSPLSKNSNPVIWPKLNPLYTQGWSMPSLVEISAVVLEQRFSKLVNNCLLCCYYFPSEKKFEWNWIPFTQGCSVPSLDDIGLMVLEKLINRNRYDWTLEQIDNKLQVLSTWAPQISKYMLATSRWNVLEYLKWCRWFHLTMVMIKI